MELDIGEKAPFFELRNDDKSLVSLDQFSGKKVVLVFFPLAFSSVCTKELGDIRDHLGEYNELEAVILAISVDSVYALKRFREDHQYNFCLLSDFNKETARSYGTIHEEFGLDMKEVAKRSVFVIHQQGILRHKEILEKPNLIPDFEKVKEVLSSL